jgi:hypothetical protein
VSSHSCFFLSFSILRVFLREKSHQDRLATTIASALDPQHPFCLPALFPVRQAAPVAILPSALFVSDIRSVPGGCSRFSRCCYLIIDLGSPLFEGSWART